MARLRTSMLTAAGVVVCSVAAAPAWAAPITWVGGGSDGSWSDAANWDASDPPDPDDELIFDGSDQTITSNDLTEGTRFDSINFNADAAAFTLAGNGVAIGDGGFIRNQSAETQTVSLNVEAEGELTLEADQGDILMLGDLTGAGDLRKTGEGFLGLTDADNTGFTGTVTIEEGTLALDTPLGGDVVLNDGEFQLFADDIVAEGQTLTLAGGTVSVAGGNRTLAGSVELTGDVIVSGGNNLQLEVTGPFEVQGDRVIEVEAATWLGLEQLVSDQAGRTLTKDGPGGLAIIGESLAFDGAIAVDGGTLAVIDELAADVTVNDEAVLSGTGSIVGDVRINDGGQHFSGMAIDGSYTLDTGGVLHVQYRSSDGSINVETVDVDGAATLGNNSTLSISGQGTLAVGDSFTGITTTDGMTDLGANVRDANAGFFVWSGAVQGDNYVLTVEQGTVFEGQARGRNNIAVARSIDQFVVAGVDESQQRLFDELNDLFENDVAAYNRALRHLAPEQVQAGPSAAVQVAQSMQGAFSARMAQQRLGIVNAAPAPANTPSAPALAGGLTLASAELSPEAMAHVVGMVHQPQPEVHAALQTRDFVHDWHVNIQTFGQLQNQDSTGDRVGYRGRTGGFLLSADRSLSPAWRVGMSVGYAHTNLNFSDGRGGGYLDHVRGGPYASYASGPWFVDGSLTAGYHRSNLSRGVRVGQINLTADSEAHNFDVAAYVGGGYDFELGRSFTLTPLASLDYLFYRQGSFTESGAGPANLDVDSGTTNSLNATLGARLRRIIPLGDTIVIPEGSVGYRYAVLDEHRTTARFVGAPDSFTITNNLDSQHTAIVGAGASALFGETTSVYGHIQSELASDDLNHLFNVGLQFRF